jgi:hypothetical protein
VDYFFRFLEVIVIKEISAAKIIEVLTAVISCYFLSRTLVSDNGPCFILEIFKILLSCLDIKHHLTSALWLQADRTIEQQNINQVKRLHIAQASGENWNVILLTYCEMMMEWFKKRSHRLLGNDSINTYHGNGKSTCQ